MLVRRSRPTHGETAPYQSSADNELLTSFSNTQYVKHQGGIRGPTVSVSWPKAGSGGQNNVVLGEFYFLTFQ